ncbi:DUF2141 domain-containing protein [Sediminibacterium goheungense]|uniref:Uncharacterized protein (DUF2141 family) n=1 Tax=Sediminibacterium goheungense TaxID=1086393 RepID=A0A4R6IWA7_9BACT|nr:DUF2141 domain-containing protein [Sediminibacterium goheungense]TDO26286.1 uncharacterized protein (DUF2141 family) [Sediminibacterium goheungense]
MKNLILLVIGISGSLICFSQDKRQTVIVTNLENIKGDLYIGWYNESSTFRINEKAIYREKIKVYNQKEISVDFIDIPNGKYAIAVFLDENNNYKLDKNIFGIPKEKYGFSNNILPALRAATFEESVFELKQQRSAIKIKLK